MAESVLNFRTVDKLLNSRQIESSCLFEEGGYQVAGCAGEFGGEGVDKEFE